MFSIIIPIHNGEQTLKRCLDSVLKQTETHFEVLMVENGSNDRSSEICQKYVKIDSRFKLIHMPSSDGPSAARNRGLVEAKGEYICFIDCDDYVDAYYLDELKKAYDEQRADLVFMGCHRVFNNGELIEDCIPEVENPDDIYTTITKLNDQDLYGYTWIKSIKKSTIGNIQFREDLNLLEDEVFTGEVILRCKKIGFLKKAAYYYIMGNSMSLMGRTHEDFCEKCDIAFKEWEEILKNWQNKEEYLVKLANRFTDRSRYYGFERKVNTKLFFEDLSKTHYFKRCSLDDEFCNNLRVNKMKRLYIQKWIYKMKNNLYNIKKKCL